MSTAVAFPLFHFPFVSFRGPKEGRRGCGGPKQTKMGGKWTADNATAADFAVTRHERPKRAEQAASLASVESSLCSLPMRSKYPRFVVDVSGGRHLSAVFEVLEM